VRGERPPSPRRTPRVIMGEATPCAGVDIQHARRGWMFLVRAKLHTGRPGIERKQAGRRPTDYTQRRYRSYNVSFLVTP
jgi:hypothetical protein